MPTELYIEVILSWEVFRERLNPIMIRSAPGSNVIDVFLNLLYEKTYGDMKWGFYRPGLNETFLSEHFFFFSYMPQAATLYTVFLLSFCKKAKRSLHKGMISYSGLFDDFIVIFGT